MWAYVPEGVLSLGKINTILKSSSKVSVNFHVVGKEGPADVCVIELGGTEGKKQNFINMLVPNSIYYFICIII